jgi:hypothetical protein
MRENMTNDRRSFFTLQFGTGSLICELHTVPNKVRKYRPGTSSFCAANMSYRECEVLIGTLREDVPKFDSDGVPGPLCEFLSKLPLRIAHSSEIKFDGVLTKGLLQELNNISDMLNGTISGDSRDYQKAKIDIERMKAEQWIKQSMHEVLEKARSTPLDGVDGDDVFNVFLGDDHHQHQVVPLRQMPSGWRAYASICAWLASLPQGSICLLEEPEVHLHPRLQRVLIDRVFELSRENRLQLLISTHSPFFINTPDIPDLSTKLFRCNEDNRLEEVEIPTMLLRDLGVLGSDLLQTNGVIWVEGESDKVYFEHWIAMLMKEKYGANYKRGRFDFQIHAYGGASLANFSAEDDVNELTKLPLLNRNFLVIFDRDHDFQDGPDGTPKLTALGSYKSRLWNELALKGSSGRVNALVTDGYTIEHYLPTEFFKEYFEQDSDKATPLNGRRKVAIANRYVKKHTSFAGHKYENHLRKKIEHIVNEIEIWNQ